MRFLSSPFLPARLAVAGIAAYGVAAFAVTAPLAAQELDRSHRPASGTQPSLVLPKIEMRKLKNGVDVAVMQDHRLPVVSVNAMLDIPSGNDPLDKTGLQGVTFGMLREGTARRTADQLVEASSALGMSVSPTGFFTITANLDSALALMAEQLLQPAFPPASLDRIKANLLTSLKQQKENPGYLAGTVFRTVLYGASHPYSRQQTEASVSAITRDDVVKFYQTYIAPPNVKFIVAGDITPDAAVAKLNAAFGAWKAGKSAKVTVPTPAPVKTTKIYLYDRPNSPQSIILIGGLGPRRDTPDYFAIDMMNTVFGGAFSSRLNLNLREAHGFTYGANSSFSYRRVPQVGTFVAQAPVQSNKTDSALVETMRELKEIRDGRKITQAEFDFAKATSTKGLPLQFETVNQRAGAVMGLLNDNLPLNYYETLSAKINGVSLAQAQAAVKYMDPNALAIVIVGDRKQIEAGLRAANLAPVEVVNLDGTPAAN